MVKPSGDPESSTLAVLWHYPPKPKAYASRHFDVFADADNSCMRIVGKKLGVAGDLESNIFMIEHCSMRTEVQWGDENRLPTPYNAFSPRDVVNANIAFQDNVVEFSDLSVPVSIQLGKKNAHEQMAKTDKRILPLALPDVPIYKDTQRHIGIVFDSLGTVSNPVRRVLRMVFQAHHAESTYYQCSESATIGELNDKLWNYAGVNVNTR
ncbi:hypothetical protein LTR17_000224 [Elasticomyces elasticus]|nr:hypothetical protein LTR17_000224 [Elasticomyces elasticus]